MFDSYFMGHLSIIFASLWPYYHKRVGVFTKPQSAEITINQPKSTCLPVFLMVTEHVAVQLPWLTNKLTRVSQPILIEHKMLHGSKSSSVYAGCSKN